MTEPLTQNRVDIKAILADPLLREELVEGATDFICKVEGIHRKGDLKMTDQPLSPAARAVLDAFVGDPTERDELEDDCRYLAAALRAAVDQVIPDFWDSNYSRIHAEIAQHFLAITAELEGVTSR